MTNPDYTAVAMLVDRSGSMAHGRLHLEAIAGMNKLIEDQRALPGRCTLRVSQFDEHYEDLYVSTDIADVPEAKLDPRGMTALYDGWGKLMVAFGAELDALPEDERPANVIFVVVTDGGENSSREWTSEKVKQMVEEQTDKYGWNFIYLGSNQDAALVGTNLGVRAAQTMTYDSNAVGTHAAYGATSSVITRTRTGQGGDLNQ